MGRGRGACGWKSGSFETLRLLPQERGHEQWALDDLRALAGLRSLEGVIVGKALYEGRFTVAEALEVL